MKTYTDTGFLGFGTSLITDTEIQHRFCGKGTTLRDGVCVVDDKIPTTAKIVNDFNLMCLSLFFSIFGGVFVNFDHFFEAKRGHFIERYDELIWYDKLGRNMVRDSTPFLNQIERLGERLQEDGVVDEERMPQLPPSEYVLNYGDRILFSYIVRFPSHQRHVNHVPLV